MGGVRSHRKIGMGVPIILGFVEWECRKWGVPIFFVTPGRNVNLHTLINPYS